MPLDSTVALTKAENSNMDAETPHKCASEREFLPSSNKPHSWCYLFVHRARVQLVVQKLQKEFTIFIHKSVVYKHGNHRVKPYERATFANLVFVQGNDKEVQRCLNSYFYGLYCVKDCSTARVAVIPDEVMQPFMRMAQLHTTRIRFMPHAFDYYAEGNALIRITSGPLAGMEGYRIRIARDKCFVTSLGGLTVAIGGIYKETFENIEEYVQQRRQALHKREQGETAELTPLQQKIDSLFFTPQTLLDIVGIAHSVQPWVERTHKLAEGKAFEESANIALFLLEEIGSRMQHIASRFTLQELTDIIEVCTQVDATLQNILASSHLTTDLKHYIESVRESLAIRYAWLPIQANDEAIS